MLRPVSITLLLRYAACHTCSAVRHRPFAIDARMNSATSAVSSPSTDGSLDRFVVVFAIVVEAVPPMDADDDDEREGGSGLRAASSSAAAIEAPRARCVAWSCATDDLLLNRTPTGDSMAIGSSLCHEHMRCSNARLRLVEMAPRERGAALASFSSRARARRIDCRC